MLLNRLMSPKYFAEMILLAALWGASFMFLRVATPEFGAIVLIEIRVLIASLFLLPIWWLRERSESSASVVQNWRGLILLGALNSAIPFVLFAYSTLSITGGLASILNSTAPIWAALVAYLWLGKGLSISALVGMLLGLAGVAVLVSGSTSGEAPGIRLGAAAALSATLFYGIAANYASVKLSGVTSLTIATFSLVAATLLLSIPALLSLPDTAISTRAWLAVLAMGIFSTGLANILYFRLIANVGSTRAITVAFLIPIFGTLFGVIFLNETVTLAILTGAAIVLCGTALVTGVLSLPTHNTWRRKQR